MHPRPQPVFTALCWTLSILSFCPHIILLSTSCPRCYPFMVGANACLYARHRARVHHIPTDPLLSCLLAFWYENLKPSAIEEWIVQDSWPLLIARKTSYIAACTWEALESSMAWSPKWNFYIIIRQTVWPCALTGGYGHGSDVIDGQSASWMCI